MKKFFPQKNRGFTIMETLVAIFILITAISATLTAAHTGLTSSYYARDKIAAIYLAQEAVEYIRNMRDENWLNKSVTPPTDWLTAVNDINSCVDDTNSGKLCYLDAGRNLTSKSLSLCEESGTFACPNLQIRSDLDGNFLYYGYPQTGESGWTNSIFNRSISIKKVSDSEIGITVTIKWKTSTFNDQTITVRENLFNWHE